MQVVTVEQVRKVIDLMDKDSQRSIRDGSGKEETFCLSDCDVSENIAQWINEEYDDAQGVFEDGYSWGIHSIAKYVDEMYPIVNLREETND